MHFRNVEETGNYLFGVCGVFRGCIKCVDTEMFMLRFIRGKYSVTFASPTYKGLNCSANFLSLKINMMPLSKIYPVNRHKILYQIKTQKLKIKLKNAFESDILHFS